MLWGCMTKKKKHLCVVLVLGCNEKSVQSGTKWGKNEKIIVVMAPTEAGTSSAPARVPLVLQQLANQGVILFLPRLRMPDVVMRVAAA